MATQTSSYLQTLPQDDAIAFVASLQKVQEHLSRELQWMNEQVQQKTIQLQGIETLLVEASTLGLITAIPPNTSVLPETSAVPIVIPDFAGEADSVTVPQNLHSSQSPSMPTGHSSTKAGKGSNATAGKTSAQARVSKSSPASAVRKVAKSNTPKSTSSKRESKGPKDLRELLLPKFADKNLKETVIQVLQDANQPMHLNEIVIEMYGLLADADFKRAKVSLMNVLSMSRNEGIWQNLGQGRYVARALNPS